MPRPAATSFTGTPGRMRINATVASLLPRLRPHGASFCLRALDGSINRAGANTEQVVRVQQIYTDLLRADAVTTNGFLQGGGTRAVAQDLMTRRSPALRRTRRRRQRPNRPTEGARGAQRQARLLYQLCRAGGIHNARPPWSAPQYLTLASQPAAQRHPSHRRHPQHGEPGARRDRTGPGPRYRRVYSRRPVTTRSRLSPGGSPTAPTASSMSPDRGDVPSGIPPHRHGP